MKLIGNLHRQESDTMIIRNVIQGVITTILVALLIIIAIRGYEPLTGII